MPGATACASTPGVEYRHLCVVPHDWADADCVPPHDLTGDPAVLPVGPAAAKLVALMDASKPVVRAAAADVGSRRHPDLAVGAGREAAAARRSPSISAYAGRMSSAVDLVRGLGVLTGIEVVDVPGATAGFDNDYAAAARRRPRVARRP